MTNTVLAVVCAAAWFAAATVAQPSTMWIAMGGAAMVLGVLLLFVRFGAMRALLRPTSRLLWIGVGVGGLMTVGTHVLYPLSVRVAPFIASNTVILYAAFRGPSRALASALLIPIVVGEELVWRGCIQTELMRRFEPRTGTILAAGLYALAHAPIGSPVLVVVALGCGAVWGTLRAVGNSLVPPLLAHLVWDGLVLLWFPLG